MRERAAVFDQIIEQTDVALRDSVVTEALGSLATELIGINDRLFLPNMRHGQAIIPEAEENTANPALLPVDKHEARIISEVLQPILSRRDLSWTITGEMHSDCYGVSMDLASVTEHMEGNAVPAATFDGENIDEDILLEPMRTQATTFQRVGIKGDHFTASRPVVAFSKRLARQAPRKVAASLAHEEVHVRDALEDGPLAMGLTYEAAGEYRAYHVDNTIDNGKRFFAQHRYQYQIEMFRREHADPNHPFRPTQEMVDMMVSNGFVYSAK